MATLNAIVYLIATSLTDGRDQIAGDKDLGGALTLTNGEHFQTGSVVADDYQEEQLWATGQGGLSTFEVGVLESDKDVILFLSDGAVDSTMLVKAGIPAVFGGQIYSAMGGDGSAATGGNVDDVQVKRDVADGTGNAYVTVTLYG
jgi:hypothetical protein